MRKEHDNYWPPPNEIPPPAPSKFDDDDSDDNSEILPEKIPDKLLWNMVLRYDHGLGYSGYYDQDFFKGGPTHEERLVSAKTLMNQLYEEVLIHFNDNS